MVIRAVSEPEKKADKNSKRAKRLNNILRGISFNEGAQD